MVSLIIPIYNVQDYICETLKSVVNQTYRDFEVILVDDCGFDKSMDLVKEFIKNNSEFAWRICIHEANKGLSTARNTGLIHAKGEFVFFLDSDDIITPDCLELLVDSAKKHPDSEMIIGDYDVIGKGTKPNSELRLLEGAYTGKNMLHHYIKGDYYVMVWNKLIRRDFIEKYNLFFVEGLIHEDNVWSFQSACWLRYIAVVRKTTLYYRLRENSIISSTKQDLRRSHQARGLVLNAQYLLNNSIPLDCYIVTFMENDRHWLFRFFMNNGSRQVAKDMYQWMRKVRYWSPIQLWKQGCNKWIVLRSCHQYLPYYLGRLYYYKSF